MAAALGAATDERLAAVPEDAWHAEQTLLDKIVFFGWHEGYHLGVIGSIRKALGYKSPSEKIMEQREG